MARKPRMVVAIALAYKMARRIWAMQIKSEDYRNPMPVRAAQYKANADRLDERGARRRRIEWTKNRTDMGQETS